MLRPMAAEDAERFSEAFRAIGWSKPVHTFRSYVRQEAAGKRWTRVAEWKSKPAGYVTLLWESEDPDFRKRGVPEIVDLNVLPDYRDRGIGGALLSAAESEATKRCETLGIRVGLHAGYGAAQRIYVQRGYVPDGAGVVVRGQIPEEGSEVRLDDEAVLRMTKPLRS